MDKLGRTIADHVSDTLAVGLSMFILGLSNNNIFHGTQHSSLRLLILRLLRISEFLFLL